MRKNLQERFARFHASFPLDDVYLQLPRPIRNDAYLYLLALNGHQRAKESDGNVPVVIAKEIARMMGLNAERMLSSLEVIVDKDSKSRVVSRNSTHVVLLKYAKWQDLPEEIAELKAKRSEAGKVGGLNSAKARAVQASAEANAEPPAEALATANAKQPLQHPSKQIQAEREIEREGEIEEHGDKAEVGGSKPASPSPQVQVLRLLDWLLAKRGWSSWSSHDSQRHEASLAMHIVELGLPRDELYARLDAWWAESDPDDRPSSLEYFWTRLQDEQHAHLKQQGRPHVRTDSDLAKVTPSMPKGAKP